MSTGYTEQWLKDYQAKRGLRMDISDAPKRNKYRAIKTEVDGLTFDSGKEALRWQELRLLERAGKIRNLERQVKFSLDVNGEHVANYFADFIYDSDGERIVEDCKGMRTREYVIKRKLMFAVFGIRILET